MKQIFKIIIPLLILVIGCGKSGTGVSEKTAGRTYINPLDVSIGDPHIMLAGDGRYYMTGTGGGRDSTAYHAYSSENLIDWVDAGNLLLRDPETSWCIGSFWAPELYYLNGRYYMFYSAQWRDNPTNELENFRIGVAVSDKPDGPYRDIVNKPLFDPGYPAIDANLLVDTDGRLFLYYSRCCYKNPVESELADWARAMGMYNEIEESWIYGVELKNDFSGIIGDPVVLVRPPETLAEKNDSWENRSVVNGEANRRWTEAPTSFKNKDTYYIMYSANSVAGSNYDLGYATSKNPLGPFRKADNNPVTETMGDVINPAHNCVVFSPDHTEMYCVYGGRSMRAAIETAKASPEGLELPSVGLDGQPLPTGFMGQGPPAGSNGAAGRRRTNIPAGASARRRVMYMDKMEILPDGKLVVYCGITTPQTVPSIN